MGLTLIGRITDIGQVNTFKRVGKTSLSKQEISLTTVDGQILFCEVRPENFDKLQFMRIGMQVEVELIFMGSIKEARRYNNIIAQEIDVVG